MAFDASQDQKDRQRETSYSGNPRDGYGDDRVPYFERRLAQRRVRQPEDPGMFAPYGGSFPFLNGIPSGELAQSWMPPIMPPGGMPATPPQNLSELYSAYGAGPSGVMPGFLPPARPQQPPAAPPSPPQGGGLSPWQMNNPLVQRYLAGLGGQMPFSMGGFGGQQPVMRNPGTINPGTITPLGG